jgi:hypothetical protein
VYCILYTTYYYHYLFIAIQQLSQSQSQSQSQVQFNKVVPVSVLPTMSPSLARCLSPRPCSLGPKDKGSPKTTSIAPAGHETLWHTSPHLCLRKVSFCLHPYLASRHPRHPDTEDIDGMDAPPTHINHPQHLTRAYANHRRRRQALTESPREAASLGPWNHPLT